MTSVSNFASRQRKAGKREFSDEFVGSAPMQAMQRRISTELDLEIEKMGFDKMRSRIGIRLKNGPMIEGWADERYRGGPENPLGDRDLEAKVRSCCEGILDEKKPIDFNRDCLVGYSIKKCHEANGGPINYE